MGNFTKDLEIGKNGEEETLKILNNLPKINTILDVRNDKLFQDLDIDFLIKDIKNNILKIEVKTDTQADYTNNLFYETISNIKYNTIGCFKKTKSDIIFYYIANGNKMYRLDTKKLQNFVKNNKFKLKEVEGGDNALGFLIDFNLLKNEKIAKEIILN